MATLQTRVQDSVLNEAYPILGAGLGETASGGEVTLNATATLGTVLADTLDTLALAASQSESAVQAALQAALQAANFVDTVVGVVVNGAGEAVITLTTGYSGNILHGLAADLGLPGLGLVGEGNTTLGADFGYDLRFGTGSSGFFFDTSAGAEVTLDLSLGSVSLSPVLTLNGQTYDVGAATAGLAGVIAIDLQDGDNRLTAGQMSNATLVAMLDGTVNLDVELALATQGAMTPPISATLSVDWAFDGAGIDPGDSNATFGDRPIVGFDNVTMDLGTFMEEVVAPLTERLNDLLDPIRPVIDILNASIGVLEGLPFGLNERFDTTGEGDVTLIDLLGLVFPNANLSGFAKVVEIADKVQAWSEFLTQTAFAGGDLALGEFGLGNADIRAPNFDLSQALAEFGELAADLGAVVAGLTGAGWTTTDPGSQMTGREILQDILGDSVFDLPILTDPAQWVQLFLGNPVDLIEVDLPEVVIGTDTTTPLGDPLDTVTFLRVPLFPLIWFEVSGGFQARFNLDFGFSSRGLIDPDLQAIDGFYMVDHAGDPEIALRTTIAIGVALRAGILTVDGRGDLSGDILLDLADIGSTSGRLYYDEFIDAFATNPYSIFDASGVISAGLTIVIDSFLGEIWSWHSPRVILGEISFDGINSGVNPTLATRTGDQLLLNTGPLAPNRQLGLIDDHPETVMVNRTGDPDAPDEISLSINGTARVYTGITEIVADLGFERDSFQIEQTLDIQVNVTGGQGHDTLTGAALADTLSGGEGRDVLLAGAGADQLYGGTEADTLAGEAGADTLDGGDGRDAALYFDSDAAIDIDLARATQIGGHAQGDVLTSVEVIYGSAHNDSIAGSQGEGSFLGMEGDDTLRSGANTQALMGGMGNDLLEGAGNDTLVGGEGDDIYIVHSSDVWISENEIGEIDIAAGSDSGYDWVQGHASIDLRLSDAFIERITLFGTAEDVFANGRDNLIEGNAEDNLIYGIAGHDTILGNQGNDRIFGGGGDDSLSGGDGNDSLEGGNGNDVVLSGDGNDTLIGGVGDDTLWGFAGNDTLRGEEGIDSMLGGLGNDYFEVGTGDGVYEGADDGTDFVFATETHTLVAGQEVEVLSLLNLEGRAWATVFNGSAAARAFGFYGLGQLYGQDGDELDGDLTGNNLNQVLLAHLGTVEFGRVNRLEGMAGADTLVGDGLRDWAVYLQSNAAVSIDLSAEAQTGGHAQGDDLFGLRNVEGSAFNDTITGESELDVFGQIDPGVIGYANELDGAGGDDLIQGLEGNDTLRGGSGNDTLLGGKHMDSLIGGAGNDSLRGGTELDRLYGGEGNDLLYDESSGDLLDGGAGNDTLQADAHGGAADGAAMYGGAGNDSLIGAALHDTLEGGDGADILIGGAGSDLFVADMADTITDSAGQDTLRATENFVLAAGLAIEVLEAQGGAGNISLFGNTLAQTILGNSGANFLHGGAGADTINGGTGRDTGSYLLSGAAVLVNLNGAGQAVGHAQGDLLASIEQLQGSIFADTLIGRSTVHVGLNSNDEHRGEAGNDRIEDIVGQNTLLGGLGNDTLLGSGAFVTTEAKGSLLSGGAGNDSLNAGIATAIGGDTLAGGLGDDTYRVTSIGDIVSENFMGDIATGADGGHDTPISDVTVWSMSSAGQVGIEDAILGLGRDLTGNALGNSLTGNSQNNSLNGLDGDDSLFGLVGNDTLIGGNGNDVLDGGSGNDIMTGGYGDDLFHVGASGDTATDYGNGGNDTVRASVTHTLSANIENLILTGLGAINGTGNALANRITGNLGNNRLNGLTGADTLAGGAGNDVYVTDGGDTITELFNGGTDRVESSATHTLGSALEDLTLTGAAAINGTGNSLANRLTGNAKANVLNGGTGADTLAGGAGNDTYITDGGDTLTEGAAAGIDLVQSSATITLGANLENLTLTGAGDIAGTGNTAGNVIIGNGANNTLRGLDGHDSLSGGSGNDNQQGGLGNDTLVGGNGDDTLSGGDGADLLTGSLGKDRLAGGLGADTFILKAITETTNDALTCDVITDFLPGTDRIDLSAIDASVIVPGSNAFRLVAAIGTTTGGEVAIRQVNLAGTVNDHTLVLIDTDGDTAAEALIRLTGLHSLTGADLVL